MKRIYIITAVLCLGLFACNDINDLNSDIGMTTDEKFVTEMEDLISAQDGNFDRKELYSRLTSSVLIWNDAIFYWHSGEVTRYTLVDSNEPQPSQYLFFDDDQYWTCYDAVGYPGYSWSTEPCSLKNDWNYNLETNELTIKVDAIFESIAYEAKSEVVFFDGVTMMTKGYFRLHDKGFKEVINIFKFEEERKAAEDKYKSDLVLE